MSKSIIEITVKDENFLLKFFSLTWIIRIFTKSTTLFVLDRVKHPLKARKEPYAFSVEPGKHSIQFIDPREKSKRRTRAFTGAVWGGMFGAATGLGGLSGTVAGAMLANGTNDDGSTNVSMADGYKLCLTCKPNRKGTVTVSQTAYQPID